jgi:hypothetical protein
MMCVILNSTATSGQLPVLAFLRRPAYLPTLVGSVQLIQCPAGQASVQFNLFATSAHRTAQSNGSFVLMTTVMPWYQISQTETQAAKYGSSPFRTLCPHGWHAYARA